MKTIWGILFIAAILLGAACAYAAEIIVPRREQIDVARLIDCIGMAEGGDPDALGGRYCILEGTWKDRTAMPYSESRIPDLARRVGIQHLEWIANQLERHRITPTVERIAQCWRFGLGSYLQFRRTGNYASRMENLYRDFKGPS